MCEEVARLNTLVATVPIRDDVPLAVARQTVLGRFSFKRYELGTLPLQIMFRPVALQIVALQIVALQKHS
jgi:hypothetical protein